MSNKNIHILIIFFALYLFWHTLDTQKQINEINERRIESCTYLICNSGPFGVDCTEREIDYNFLNLSDKTPIFLNKDASGVI